MKTNTDSTTTRLQANERGRVLLRKLNGVPGMKLRVWENLGWHYSVENDHFRVDPSCTDGYYYAMMKPALCVYSARAGDNFRDPIRAIKFALRNLEKFLEPLNKLRAATRDDLTGL